MELIDEPFVSAEHVRPLKPDSVMDVSDFLVVHLEEILALSDQICVVQLSSDEHLLHLKP